MNINFIIFIKLIFTNLFSNLVKIFSILTIAKFLGPSNYGVISFANVFSRYFSYLQLGVQNGLNRKIPILLGEKKYYSIMIFLMTALSHIFILSFVLLLCSYFLNYFGISFFINKKYYFLVALNTSSVLLNSYFISYLIVTQKYNLLVKIKFIFEIVFSIVMMVMVYLFSISGYFINVYVNIVLMGALIIKRTKL